MKKIKCQCGKKINVSEKLLGKTGKCPRCKNRILISEEIFCDDFELDSINDYKVIGEMSVGTFGFLYKVQDKQQQEYVARVAFPLEETIHNKFLHREYENLRMLDHPNVVKCVEFGKLKFKTQFYLILEYIPGKSLQQYLQSKSRMHYKVALSLVKKISEIVKYLHSQKLIHCQLKPSNIILTPEFEPVLINFSHAKITGSEPSGELIINSHYISPQQQKEIPSRIDEKFDIYALGCLLYELLTGVASFVLSGSVSGIIVKEIPKHIDQIIESAVTGQYESVGELISEISDLLHAEDENYQKDLEQHFASDSEVTLEEILDSDEVALESLDAVTAEEVITAEEAIAAKTDEELVSHKSDLSITAEEALDSGELASSESISEDFDSGEVTLADPSSVMDGFSIDGKAEKNQTPSSPKLEFPGYKILEKLGHGGMGVVYKALDIKLERIVALKVMNLENETSKQSSRFRQEMQALAKLHHPNIVRLLTIGDQPKAFFTMDFVDGATLDKVIDKKSYKDIATIFKKITEALFVAHQHNIIHRDIKPSNIIVDKQGEPRLMDFGLAKIISQSGGLSKTGDVLGTLSFMAPEQANGSRVDIRSDIYSVGATLYHILTGRPPFQGESNFNIIFQVCYQDAIEPRLLNPGIPKELEAICLKCLEKNPNRRYSNAHALASDFNNFYENRPVHAHSPNIFTHTRKFMARNKLSVAFGFLLATLTTAFVLLHVLSIQKSERQAKIAADSANLHLAKITLSHAEKSSEQNLWAECGTFAGNALEFLHKLKTQSVDPSLEKLQQQANHLIDLSIKQRRIIWQSKPPYRNLGKIIHHPDGKTLVGIDKQGHNLEFWDIATGKYLKSLSSSLPILKAVFHSTGKYLAYSDSLGNIYIYNTATEDTRKIIAHSMEVHALDFHPQQEILVSGSFDQSIMVWNCENLQKIAEWRAHEDHILHVNFHPQGELLGSCCRSTAKVWHWKTPKLLEQIEKEQGITRMNFSPNGKILAIGSIQFTELWNVSEQGIKKLFESSNLYSSGFAILDTGDFQNFSPDSKYLASIQPGMVVILECSTGNVVGKLPMLFTEAFSLLFPNNNEIVCSGDFVQCWKQQQGVWKTRETSHFTNVTEAVFSPNDQLLATKDQMGKVVLWEVSTGRIIQAFLGVSFTNSIKFMDNSKLVFIDLDHNVCFWDNEKNHLDIIEFSGDIRLTAFNQDCSELALFCEMENTNKIVIYDLKTRQKRYYETSKIESMALSREKLAVAMNNKVQIWDRKTWKVVQEIPTRTLASRMCFDLESNLLAMSNDQIQIWDLVNKKWLMQKKPELPLFDLYLQNGKLYITSRQIHIWDIATAQQYTIGDSNDGFSLLSHNENLRLIVNSAFITVSMQDVSYQKRQTLSAEVETYISSTDKDKPYLVLSNKDGLRVFDVPSKKILAKISSSFGSYPIAKFVDKQLFYYTKDNDNIALYDLSDNSSKHILGFEENSRKITFNLDLAATLNSAGTVAVYRLETQQVVGKLTYRYPIKDILLAPNSNVLASTTADNKIIFWDAATQALRFTIKRDFWRSDIAPTQINFSKDGSLFAYNNGKFIRIWNISKQQQVASISGLYNTFAMHPNNKTIVVASDHKLLLWNIETNEIIYQLQNPHIEIGTTDFSHDGSLLLYTTKRKQKNYLEIWSIPEEDPSLAQIWQQSALREQITQYPKKTVELLFLRQVTPDLGIEIIESNIWE